VSPLYSRLRIASLGVDDVGVLHQHQYLVERAACWLSFDCCLMHVDLASTVDLIRQVFNADSLSLSL